MKKNSPRSIIATRLSDNPFTNPPAHVDELVEVYDGDSRPFLVTSLKKARRFGLSRRVVHVSLRNTRREIYLQRRAMGVSHYPGLWDISVVSQVMAGESLVGAALRGMEINLGLSGVRLKTAYSLPYRSNRGATLLATFFLGGPISATPVLNTEIVSDGMYVDKDELRGLAELHPDMFTPELHWALRSGWIFQ